MIALLLLLASPAVAQAPDPVLDGIVAEVERAKELRLPDREPAHHILVRAQDGWELRARAHLGQLTWSVNRPLDTLKVQVRAGTPEFDSSGLDTGWQGSGMQAMGLPDRPTERAVREALWRGLDRSYKQAVETLGRKMGAKDKLRSEDMPQRDWQVLDDTVQVLERATVQRPELEPMEALATALSGELRDRGFEDVEVEVSERVGNRIIVSSDGTRVVVPYRWLWVGMEIAVRDADGESRTFRDFVTVRTRQELPSRQVLSGRLAGLAERAEAWAAAPRLEAPWYGPVLVEGRAAANLLSGPLMYGLRGTPRPADWQFWDQTVDPAYKSYRRPGTRVLPRGWTVVDDPTLEEGRCCYAIDWEGTPARPVTLVQDGVVVAHLMSRTPNEHFAESTGHARPGDSRGRAEAKPSWTTVTPRTRVSRARLHRLAHKEARRQGVDRVLLLEERRDVGWWLYADGRKEPVRGFTSSELDVRALRGVTVSGPSSTHDLNGGRARMTAPDLLFDNVAIDVAEPSQEAPRRRSSPLAGG